LIITAHCQRDEDWWIVDVPEVDGALTQGRTLEEAAFMAADAVALLLDIDPSTIEVRVVTEPHPVTA
jgi:predicted RNase H-like HicB family nuclease